MSSKTTRAPIELSTISPEVQTFHASRKNGMKAVQGQALSIVGWSDFKFFIYCVNKWYYVCEATSGMAIDDGHSQATGAIGRAEYTLLGMSKARLRKVVKEALQAQQEATNE